MLLRYAFLADSASLDQASKLSAIGIFEAVFAPTFPTIVRDMTLVLNLEGTIAEKGEHKISIEFRDDKSNKLAGFEQKINLQNPAATQGVLRAGIITKFQDVPVQRAGQYEFVIFGDDRFLGRVIFTAHKIEINKMGEK